MEIYSMNGRNIGVASLRHYVYSLNISPVHLLHLCSIFHAGVQGLHECCGLLGHGLSQAPGLGEVDGEGGEGGAVPTDHRVGGASHGAGLGELSLR